METEEWNRPRLLRRGELRDIADLAEQIIARLRLARREIEADGSP